MRYFTGDGIDEYFRLFEPAYKWRIHDPRTPIWLKYIDFFYDVLGDRFLIFFQDLYFRAAETDLYTRARLKQLTWRHESALQDYDHIIENGYTAQSKVLLIDYEHITKDIMKAEALFFKGQTYRDMGDYPQCVATLQEYLRAFPRGRWNELAYYYLGEGYEKAGQLEKAESYYTLLKGPRFPRTPAPTRLKRLIERTEKGKQSGMKRRRT
jgi:tetratricopeptide (TPR) repeat protein